LLPKTATNCCPNKLLPKTATGNKLLPEFVAENGNKLLRKTATNRQQIVASGQCGQALKV